jgi:Putative DNA-binding domain
VVEADEHLGRLSDEELLQKLTDTENNFIERKPISANTKAWFKTIVAFANSCPIGYPGVLFIGVNDDGSVQTHKAPINFETLQKTVSEILTGAWPPIYHESRTLKKNDLEFLAVTTLGSPQRPHFAGKAYVRVGPETREASDEQYDVLIAQRTSTLRQLQKLMDREILWQPQDRTAGTRTAGYIVACNQFYITIHQNPSEHGKPRAGYRKCFPIDWVLIAHDPHTDRPLLIIKEWI